MAASAGSWSAPSLLYWEKPDGTMVAVDENGAPLDSPPHLKEVSAESLGYDPSVGPLVIDQWGRVVVPYHPPGSYGVADDGSAAEEESNPTDTTWPPTSWPPGAEGLPASCPAISNYDYDPDDYRYWIDPSTGKPVLVGGGGGHAPTPPGLKKIGGKLVEGPRSVQDFDGKVDPWGNKMEGPQSVQDLDGKVIDQWGNEIKPLWSDPTLEIGTDGTPLPSSMTAGSATPATQSWSLSTKTYWKDPSTGDLVVLDPDGTPHDCPPTLVEVGGKVYDPWGNEVKSYWPEGNLGVDEKGMPLPDKTPDNFTPPDMRYWTDPSTGDLVVLDPNGSPMQSPPALVEIEGKVVDQWGNEVKSYWPEGNLGVDEKGIPLPGSTMPDDFTPPTMRFWQDPSTGQLVAVDETGSPLTTPPQLIEVTGELREALGFPPGPYQAVVDQWGNPIIPLHPPANFGLDETGTPLEDAGSVPDWPPDEWPPGGSDEDLETAEIVDLDDDGAPVPPEGMERVDSDDSDVDLDIDEVAPDVEPEPPEQIGEVAPDVEPMSASLGEEVVDAASRYSGVVHEAGEVALDDDLNAGEESTEALITSGLDERITAEPNLADEAAAVAEDTIIPIEVEQIEVSEIEGLVMAGLEPDGTDPRAAQAGFEVEEPVPEFEVVEPAPELNRDEPVDETSDDYVPLPTLEPIVEVLGIDQNSIEPLETIESPTLADPIEDVAIEPIEILVESLDTAPVRGVAPIGEPDESERLFTLEDEDEEEEQAQT